MWFTRDMRIRLLRTGLAVLVVSFCMAGGARTDTICAETLDGAAGYGEAAPIPYDAAAPLVRRQDDTLRLALHEGEVVLPDHPSCAADDPAAELVSCFKHEFVAAFAEPAGFLIRRDHWEHTDYVWVDRKSGDETVLWDRPRFSPGLRWLISVATSEASHAYNGIQVFSLRRGFAQPVWLHVPNEPADTYYLFSFVRWTGPEAALLSAYRAYDPALDADRSSPVPRWGLVELRRSSMGWVLHDLGQDATPAR